MDESPVADLHVHTTASDGQFEVGDIPAAARDAGVECVAVTDHDRPHPDLDGPVVRVDGLTVVHGIELRVDAGDQRVDLLGFGLERTDALADIVAEIQENRVERARRIVDCVETRVGVDIDVDLSEGVGRPHLARAIDESDADYDYRDAFQYLIGSDSPCYVAREVPTFEDGVAALNEACAVVGLAHPFRYPNPRSALDLCADLDAVERYYPYGNRYDRPDVDTALLDRTVETHDLLAIGGSDAHETTLGLAGVPADAFERFGERVGL